MNHALFHSLEQEGLSFWVWPVCPYHTVDLVGSLDFACLLKKVQEVRVRLYSFLELNGVNMTDRFAKDLILEDVVKDGLLLHLKHPGTKVRAINSTLARKKLSCDLWPARVTGSGDEEVNFLVVASQSKRVL